MKESKFQADLKKELKQMFPGCIVTKLDSSDIQGIPDLLILYKNKWATLENKRSKNATKRPNQEYYEKMNERHWKIREAKMLLKDLIRNTMLRK